MIHPVLAPLLEVAAAGMPLAEYERVLFAAMDAAIGFDVGFCVRAHGIGPFTPGFDPVVRRHTESQLAGYASELHALKQAACQGSGVVVDREVLGAARLMRTRTYQEVMQPHRGRCSLHAYLGPAPEGMALLVLGRTGSDFSGRDLAWMAETRALLTVCERALQAATSPLNPPRLTSRERELLSYLRLGYSNPQIAAACGTSFRTVRNQLTQLFAKLEVATRAEAVARSYQLLLSLG